MTESLGVGQARCKDVKKRYKEGLPKKVAFEQSPKWGKVQPCRGLEQKHPKWVSVVAEALSGDMLGVWRQQENQQGDQGSGIQKEVLEIKIRLHKLFLHGEKCGCPSTCSE